MKFSVFLASFLLLFTLNAKAALLVEPVLGYNLGTKLDFGGDDTFTGGRGPAYGGRLGYQNLGFQVGLDYLASTVDMGEKEFKEDVKTSEFGAFVGFEFPILFRVYGGYIFSATGDSEMDLSGTTVKTKFLEGTGPKLGLGFTLFPFIDLNFEYRKITFGDYKLGGTKQDEEVDMTSYLLSLSLPFTF